MQSYHENAWYIIATKSTGKVIAVADHSNINGGLICLEARTDEDNQLWSIRSAGENSYRITNKCSGKALDVILASEANGANLHQWDYAGGESQQWYFEGQDDAVVIKSAKSGRCIDIAGMNADLDGAALQLWDDVDGDNQKWVILTAIPAPETSEVSEEPKQTAAPAKKPAAKKPATTKRRRTKAETDADKAAKTAAKPAAKRRTSTRKTAAKKTTKAATETK